MSSDTTRRWFGHRHTKSAADWRNARAADRGTNRSSTMSAIIAQCKCWTEYSSWKFRLFIILFFRIYPYFFKCEKDQFARVFGKIHQNPPFLPKFIKTSFLNESRWTAYENVLKKLHWLAPHALQGHFHYQQLLPLFHNSSNLFSLAAATESSSLVRRTKKASRVPAVSIRVIQKKLGVLTS